MSSRQKKRARQRAHSTRRRVNYRPTIDHLERLVRLSTVNWTNTSGGDWDTAGNWSTHSVPSSSDDVVINEPGNVTITHSQGSTDSVKTVTSSNTLVISGGTLAVSGTLADSGNLSVAGGTLANATISSGTTLQSPRPAAARPLVRSKI